jgi:hypothetical protein
VSIDELQFAQKRKLLEQLLTVLSKKLLQKKPTVVDQRRDGLRLRPRLLGVKFLGQLVERVLVDRVKLVHIVLQDVAVEEHDKVLDNIWDQNLLVLLRGLVCA